jgi:hypothetical protein
MEQMKEVSLRSAVGRWMMVMAVGGFDGWKGACQEMKSCVLVGDELLFMLVTHRLLHPPLGRFSHPSSADLYQDQSSLSYFTQMQQGQNKLRLISDQ